MSEQTDKQISESLAWLGNKATDGSEFLIEQAPLYVEELISWTLISSLLMGISMVLTCIFCIIGAILTIKRIKDSYDAGGLLLIAGVFILVAFFSAIGTIQCASKYLKAKTAPRVIVLEHVMKLQRSCN